MTGYSSGIITVSPDARLDLETGGEKYEVIVYAVDSGTPVRETATTTVTVNMIDVNNKPPTFNESTYIVHVSERAPIGMLLIIRSHLSKISFIFSLLNKSSLKLKLKVLNSLYSAIIKYFKKL